MDVKRHQQMDREVHGLVLWGREALPSTVCLHCTGRFKRSATDAFVTIHAVNQMFDMVMVGTKMSLTK